MKTLFLIILLSINVFGSEKVRVLLESISEYAIRIGDGNLSTEYVFIDPMCRHSKKYIKIILQEKSLHEENSYYIFLYRLPKFDSDELIQYIYQSKDSKLALQEVMVDEKEIDLFDFEVTEETLKVINKIALIGKKLKVDHRPQMFTFYNFLNP